MASILIVDDSAVDRELIQTLILRLPGIEVRVVEDGQQALDVLEHEATQLVVTDLVMPHIDGLHLTREIRQKWPWVPVIVITAAESAMIAEQALSAGAVAYVPKRALAARLPATVEGVLAMIHGGRQQTRMREHLAQLQCTVEIGNSFDMAAGAADLVREMVGTMWRCELNEQVRLSVLLEQALIYSILQSNLELTDEEFLASGSSPFGSLTVDAVAERLRVEPFASRSVTLHASVAPDEARFSIAAGGRSLDIPREDLSGGGWTEEATPLRWSLHLTKLLPDAIDYVPGSREMVLVRKRPHR